MVKKTGSKKKIVFLSELDKLELGISLMEMAGSLRPSGRPLRVLICILYFLIGMWLVKNAKFTEK